MKGQAIINQNFQLGDKSCGHNEWDWEYKSLLSP